MLWLRSDTQGTARARSLGASAARGEALAFVDCYVKPQAGWATSALAAVRREPRAVVVPQLVDLDCESGKETGSPRVFENLFSWEAETLQLYFDRLE